MNSLKASVQAQADQLQQWRDDQNGLEQYSKSANLEIRGLPYKRNENLRERLTQLASRLESPHFSNIDVVAVHRLPGKPEAIPTLLMRFSTVATKYSWSNARGRLQRLHQTEELPKLFFNDNLSKLNWELFWHARTTNKERDTILCGPREAKYM